MEQLVREVLDAQIDDRDAAMKRIEASWKLMRRRPKGDEILRWIRASRP